MPPLYQISDWKQHFENAEARKLESLRWYSKPNKLDGLGFARIASQRDRTDLLAAWILICDIASKTAPKEDRGKLARSGRPLTAQDLEAITRFPSQIFTRAFNFFSDPEQGWLTVTPTPETPHRAAAVDEPNAITEPISQAVSASVDSQPQFSLQIDTSPDASGTAPEQSGESSAVGEGRTSRVGQVGGANGSRTASMTDEQWIDSLSNNPAYHGIDVRREYGKMKTWCEVNRAQPTRRRFANWLNRAERPMNANSQTHKPNPRNDGIAGDRQQQASAISARVARMQEKKP